LAIAAAGCGRDPCDRVSPCANDPASTKDSRNACKTAEKATQTSLCFNETTNYALCFNDNLVCGADGKSDLKATGMKATTICSTQLAAFTSCCNTNPGSAACQ
jgi:hypothetical protein